MTSQKPIELCNLLSIQGGMICGGERSKEKDSGVDDMAVNSVLRREIKDDLR